jgi:hypothetical protein
MPSGIFQRLWHITCTLAHFRWLGARGYREASYLKSWYMRPSHNGNFHLPSSSSVYPSSPGHLVPIEQENTQYGDTCKLRASTGTHGYGPAGIPTSLDPEVLPSYSSPRNPGEDRQMPPCTCQYVGTEAMRSWAGPRFHFSDTTFGGSIDDESFDQSYQESLDWITSQNVQSKELLRDHITLTRTYKDLYASSLKTYFGCNKFVLKLDDQDGIYGDKSKATLLPPLHRNYGVLTEGNLVIMPKFLAKIGSERRQCLEDITFTLAGAHFEVKNGLNLLARCEGPKQLHIVLDRVDTTILRYKGDLVKALGIGKLLNMRGLRGVRLTGNTYPKFSNAEKA